MSVPDATPNVYITKETFDHLECIISGVSVAYVNGLRRSILNDVPTLAIDLVNIYANDSPLSDERIAHRLGLIPLWSQDHIGKMVYSCDCDCRSSFCVHCGITCELDVMNNNLDENLTVYDTDLRFPQKEDNTINTVRPLSIHDKEHYRPIIITRLAPGQRLHLSCIIRKGNGTLHAKYAPASACFHRPCVDIHLSDELFSGENLARLDGVCPRNLFSVDTAAETITVSPEAASGCIECGECEMIRADGTENGEKLVKVIQREDKFFLSLDAIGQISIHDLLIMGLDSMLNKIETLRNQFDQL